MKVPNPGRKALHRLYDTRGIATADVMSLEDEAIGDPMVLRHPIEATLLRSVAADSLSGRELLLEMVVDEGDVRAEFPGVDELRKRRERDLDRLDEGVRRLVNPHIYHVSLSERLWELKQQLVASPT